MSAPDSRIDFLQGLRATIPLVAAFIALVIGLTKLYRDRQRKLLFFSPLGFAAAYGLVGVAATVLSPSRDLALYWSLAYLSVPLVLWAVVSGNNPLDQIRLLINFNWLIIFIGVSALLAVAFLYLDFGSQILRPLDLLQCQRAGSWHGLTSGFLRSTGVGRYAALAAIILASLLWRGNRRFLLGIFLLASVALLLSTGARGSIAGFGVAIALMSVLFWGKKALVAGAGVLLIAVPLSLQTGVVQNFVDGCLLDGWDRSQSVSLFVNAGVPIGFLEDNQNSPTAPPASSKPAGLQTEDQASALIPNSVQAQDDSDVSTPGWIPDGFFTFTGRTVVWSEGWRLFKESPVLGYGFHADRVLLGTHMHNVFMHGLVQTGIIGVIPLMAALLFAWVLLVNALRNLRSLPAGHGHLIIQTAGVLAFLSIRAVFESTGAFFSVDWLLLGPLLLYVHVLYRSRVEEISAA